MVQKPLFITADTMQAGRNGGLKFRGESS